MENNDASENIKTPEDESFKLGNRAVMSDFYVSSDIEDQQFKKIFIRLNAKKIAFKKVTFDHCFFDSCYFNNCVFNTCSFIGCKFIGSNFHLCAFERCNFQYAIFERTQIEDDILDKEAPLEENLKRSFARTLRMNFQQIGDAKAVNKAISLELNATSAYLKKSWSSKETYYSKKYGGFSKRSLQFLRWLEFWILDLTWGNGESVLKLLRTIILVIVCIALYDTLVFHDFYNIHDYIKSLETSSAVFFGFKTPNEYPNICVALISAIRLTLFAFFTAILVKRFSRR
ncbi:MAG: hypothetical protein EPN17_08520 [Methylobacter sp.]|nr:MAG: hypothetical protein EPN17_08520 [Methylobacter sp.]